MQELEQEFLESGGEWGDIRLNALFDSYNGDFDIKKEHINNKGDFVITSGVANNGVLGKTSVLAKLFPKNTITVDMFGNVFYRNFEYKMVTHARVFNLLPKYKINDKHGLYLSSAISFLNKIFDYSNMCSWAKIRNMTIKLPFKNSVPDYSFMEKFVTELQASRLRELQNYLKVTGLESYELTEDEQLAIAHIESIQWDIFNLERLFGKSTRGKRLKSADRISGMLPFVTAGETDTGISAFIGNNVEVFKANTITIDMFGSAKYRNYAYGADDHIAVVHCDELPKYAVLFLTSAIHKTSNAGQFSYARNFYAKDADELNISLPTKNGKPDVELMATLGKAIEKLVIADVVKYDNREMEAYQQVIV